MDVSVIELVQGNFYRKALYLMVKTMVSFRFSMDTGKQMARKPILKITNKSPLNHH